MQILDENKLNRNQKIERVKAFNCGCGSTEFRVEGLPKTNWDKVYKDEADKRKKKQIDNADPADNANPAFGPSIDEEEQKRELSNGLPVPKLF